MSRVRSLWTRRQRDNFPSKDARITLSGHSSDFAVVATNMYRDNDVAALRMTILLWYSGQPRDGAMEASALYHAKTLELGEINLEMPLCPAAWCTIRLVGVPRSRRGTLLTDGKRVGSSGVEPFTNASTLSIAERRGYGSMLTS